LISFGKDNLTATIETDSGVSTLNLTSHNSSSKVITEGDYIVIEVNYDYDFLILPSFAGIQKALKLYGKTTMRAE
jgi:hypothetical protein